jgi:ApaG protein
METEESYTIEVDVESSYIAEQSAPAQRRYVFAYTITVHNTGSVGARLLSRHWHIKDADGRVQEVHGEGVVGVQPHIMPGEAFQYSSGAMIETAVGTMRGHYDMVADDGVKFSADIPAFVLCIPHTLH